MRILQRKDLAMRMSIPALIISIVLTAATDARAIDSIPTGDMSEGVAINPETRIAVTTNMGDGTLTVINLDERQFIRTIQVGGTPAGPAIDPTNNIVVFADKADNTMVIWSLDDGGGELVAKAPGVSEQVARG